MLQVLIILLMRIRLTAYLLQPSLDALLMLLIR